MHLQFFEESKIILQKAGQNIEKDLAQVVVNLLDLIEKGEVLDFSFTSINDKKPSLHIHMRLKGNQTLSLGKWDNENGKYCHLTGFGKSTINENSKTTLNKISEYIEFVNSHISSYLPPINKHTNYSRKSLKPNFVQFEPLLPEFLEYLTPKVEVKKFPKGFKH